MRHPPCFTPLASLVFFREQRGPIPVGEIGKEIQMMTGSDCAMKKLKEQFTGLKKVLEAIE